MNDNMEYKRNENFQYLVIKTWHGKYYGFNLNVKAERITANLIVNSDDFTVVGWKISKELPPWVNNADN